MQNCRSTCLQQTVKTIWRFSWWLSIDGWSDFPIFRIPRFSEIARGVLRGSFWKFFGNLLSWRRFILFRDPFKLYVRRPLAHLFYGSNIHFSNNVCRCAATNKPAQDMDSNIHKVLWRGYVLCRLPCNWWGWGWCPFKTIRTWWCCESLLGPIVWMGCRARKRGGANPYLENWKVPFFLAFLE